ncbi:DUF4260 domain-containing protein [Devosia sp.]|uniref:DUF4260 domain-containing protein n=1 Tax=Devosia sp. TaxID=1871048 RepID=UPI00262FF053|nr:DUF4260 domain-containing protein [Devosia sp.]
MDKHYLIWQRLEGFLAFCAGLLLFWQADAGMAWWLALLLFFAPDLSFAGYSLGSRFGGAIYNGVHLYAFGPLAMGVGLALAWPGLVAAGALWLGHSGFDRMLGYGLKSADSFSHTHLGPIGKAR